MYCINCGVKLADTESRCPLCQTVVYHPDFQKRSEESLYPKKTRPTKKANSRLPQALATAVFLFPILIVLLCDLQFNGKITWSGFVVGAMLHAYIVLILPSWFKKPNPVIFVSCDFAATALYLLYINLVTSGDWFMSFAFPVTGGAAVIVITVVTLLLYVRRGRLYIFGGAFIALGALMLLTEFLLVITFEGIKFIGWSLYPLVALAFLGGILIFLGICRPARESMERKLFI